MNVSKKARLGHDYRDYICPDSIERTADHIKLGEKYARVLFLKDYASYIKDSMVSELTELNRNLMLSIDVIPIPTDEAVREVENRLLGVETNITNWQRKQNQNNNFSAVVPYDMELQRKESKEFLDDLTTRDQRMMFAVITMVITADTKEQLWRTFIRLELSPPHRNVPDECVFNCQRAIGSDSTCVDLFSTW